MIGSLLFFVLICTLIVYLSFWAIGIGGLAVAIYNYVTYQKMLKAKPTPMICPNCNSEDVTFQNVDSSAGTVSFGGLLRVGATKINNKHVAVCKQCGHTFNYLTELDIQETKKKSHTLMIVGAVVAVIGFVLAIISNS